MLQCFPTKDQDAYILTKELSGGKFKFHGCRIGVLQNPFLYKREC